MNGLQKGAPPIVAIIAILAIIVGSVFFIKNNKTTTNPSSTPLLEAQVESKSLKILAIIVDTNAYTSLNNEINRFANDIENDTNYKVLLKAFPLTTPKETIKDYLKKLYFNGNLEVAIFIGEIPTAQYFPGTVSQTNVPTDSYYYDVYDKCPFNEDNQAFDSHDKFCNPIVLPFVVSRITAPVSGPDSIELIKNYLNKNHAFRKGTLVFDQKALIYPPLVNDIAPENRLFALEDITGSLQRLLGINTLPIYSQDQIIFADWENTTSNPEPNTMFLDELSKNHQYAYIGAHGYPQGHDFNITKDTLKKPNAFYADFYSCNVGKFTEPDYIAGYYLLGGNSMFVKANSDFTYTAIGFVEAQKLFLLKEGLPIIKTIQSVSPSFINQYFGDPTLSMPQDTVQKNSKAKITVNREELDFGHIKVCNDILNSIDCNDPSGVKKITLTIFNKGTDDLGFTASVIPDYSLDTISHSHPAQGYDSPYLVTFDYLSNGSIYSNNVVPDQQSSFVVNMLGLVKGAYTGKILIYNNDPQKPVLEIPFKVRITD